MQENLHEIAYNGRLDSLNAGLNVCYQLVWFIDKSFCVFLNWFIGLAEKRAAIQSEHHQQDMGSST